ncbi:MAG TPA: zinc ribbon domain-containing protein [Thermoleophilaceae bacterium]|nr:zinc ribbon domain-containing protein [Thermoleophilaceae bacterium]
MTPRGESRRGIATRECRRCGHVVFPPRPLCPRCGAWDWMPRVAEHGVVEAVTRRGENELAAVRTDDGPTVTALAPGRDLEVGARVRLESRVGSRRTGAAVQVRALRLDGVDT